MFYLYKYPKLIKPKTQKTPTNNTGEIGHVRTAVSFCVCFGNCRFVLRLFQSDRRTQIDALSFSSPDLLNMVGVPKTFHLDVCFTTLFPGCFFRAASQSLCKRGITTVPSFFSYWLSLVSGLNSFVSSP